MIGNETGRLTTSALSSTDETEREIMPQPARDTFPEDEVEQAFPGSTLTHVLTVTTRDQLAITIEALQAVCACGGSLEALSLTRTIGCLSHKLRINGLRARQACLLTDRLAALPGVTGASVEHQILKVSVGRSLFRTADAVRSPPVAGRG